MDKKDLTVSILKLSLPPNTLLTYLSVIHISLSNFGEENTSSRLSC